MGFHRAVWQDKWVLVGISRQVGHNCGASQLPGVDRYKLQPSAATIGFLLVPLARIVCGITCC